jgi:flagellar biosynthetic protein FliQ
MDSINIAELSREFIYVLLAISGPILGISLVVGLIISLFQALTQIQENTLTFVPKMIVIYLSLLFLGPYMLTKLRLFTEHIVDAIIAIH